LGRDFAKSPEVGSMNKITHVRLENFTAFTEFEQGLSPGVNVLIGANGTGKTHLLKVLYAACAITIGEDAEKGFPLKLRNVFNPYEGRIGRLARRLSNDNEARIVITRESTKTLAFGLELSKNTDFFHTLNEDEWKLPPLESAYIPVKEMLAHAPGFLSLSSRREIAFEEIYPDIIKRAYLPKVSDLPNPGFSRLLSSLQKTIDGKVITKGEHFFLKSRQGDLEFTLLAEGLRKLALIWLLIQNGTLSPGSVLFWDEPEANLNPSLMGQVVEIILELQRLGIQAFLATHNYVLLKEFDLRKKKDDAIRYISLFRDNSGNVTGHASDTYSNIHPNAISDTFADLYQRDIARALKGGAE
jgi:energy-coupling factor transporter ATP-binding protein EcfA2